jgi:hypothetical protein
VPDLLPFLLLVLATARLTKLVVDDRISMPLRQWVMRKNGDNGWFTFLVHCPWCTGFWVAAGIAPLYWFFGNTPYFVIPCLALALSHVVGLLAKLDQG